MLRYGWLVPFAITGCSHGACADRECSDEVEVTISETYVLEEGSELRVKIHGDLVNCVAEQRVERLAWTCDAREVSFVTPRSVTIYGTPGTVELTLLDSSGETLATTTESDLEYSAGEECWSESCQYSQMQL